MMKPSASSSNYIRGGYRAPWGESLITNPESRVYNPPGCRDMEERKKLLAEAPKFDQIQRRLDRTRCLRIAVEAIMLVIAIIWVSKTYSKEDFSELKIFSLVATSIWRTLAIVIVLTRVLSYVLISIIVILTRKVQGTRNTPYLLNAAYNTLTCTLWFDMALALWITIRNPEVQLSNKQQETVNNIQNGLLCLALGTLFWLVKIIGFKSGIISFTKGRHFDEIKTVLFAQCVIRCFLGENSNELSRGGVILGEYGKYKGRKELWDRLSFEEWERLSRYTVTDSELRFFMKMIRYATLDDELELLQPLDIPNHLRDCRTLNEYIAKRLAERIFTLAAQTNPEWIYLGDLVHFMPEALAHEALRAISKNSRISRVDFSRWMVTNFRKWRKLEVTLSDNHATFKKSNIILSFVVLTVITSWTFFILKPLATKDFFSVLLAQSAVMVVLCKDMVTRYSQCLRFFFEKHPINAGDVCCMGEKWMIVQEVRLLDSVFKTEENRKLELENTSLLQQHIHVATDEEVWNHDVNA